MMKGDKGNICPLTRGREAFDIFMQSLLALCWALMTMSVST